MSWRIWWPGNSVSDDKVRMMLELEDSFSFCWGIIRDFILISCTLSFFLQDERQRRREDKQAKEEAAQVMNLLGRNSSLVLERNYLSSLLIDNKK